MKLLLRTYSDSADSAGDPELGDLECAVIDVTPELVKRIKDQLELVRQFAKADVNLAQVTFHADMFGGPDFYGYELIDACEQLLDSDNFDPAFHDEGIIELPDKIDLAQFEPQPTEAEGIEFWLPRSDSYIETYGHYRFNLRAARKNCDIAVHTLTFTLHEPLFQKAMEAADVRP